MASLSEFSLIEKYFKQLTSPRSDTVLGIGDDCALLSCPADKVVAVSIDTLVSGVHFFADVDPESLGYKSLAVGLSDLAAMGAEPAWFTLALTLPQVDENWLQAFAKGLSKIAAPSQIQLVGGDTTRGPLTISIQVHGHVSAVHALRRDGAKPGDRIYVSGTLGDAGAALKRRLDGWHDECLSEQDWRYLQQRLLYPTPRNELGLALAGSATSAIDISDGLLADLGHILDKSEVGASIKLDLLPLSSAMKKLAPALATKLALTSGDDYEICFTLPVELAAAFESRFTDDITFIGEITAQTGIQAINAESEIVSLDLKAGYDHFST